MFVLWFLKMVSGSELRFWGSGLESEGLSSNVQLYTWGLWGVQAL